MAGTRAGAAAGRLGAEQLEAPYLEALGARPHAEPSPALLDRAHALAAEAWGARRTWFLVGGAAEASRAVCLSVARSGGSAVLQRDAHLGTVRAIVAAGLHATAVEPDPGPAPAIGRRVSPTALDQALAAEPEATAAFVVSPTGLGAVADVAALAEVAHARGAALVVDETWGAHLPFHESLPTAALAAGADLVISVVGSVPGGPALLHLGHASDRIEPGGLSVALGLVHDAMPADLAALDEARRRLAVDGHGRLQEAVDAAASAREELRRVPGVDVADDGDGRSPIDPTCIALDVRRAGADGLRLAETLAVDHGVRPEVATEDALAVHLGAAEDAPERAARLVEGVAQTITAEQPRRRRFARAPEVGPLVLSPREAYLAPHLSVFLAEAAGRVAAGPVSIDGSGAAAVLPGERLTEATVAALLRALGEDDTVGPVADTTRATIAVVAEPAAAVAGPAPAVEPDPAPAVEPAPAPTAAAPSAFERFPAQAYLEKYYGGVGPENELLLRSILHSVQAASEEVATDRVVEVAGGPALFSMLTLAAVRDRPFERVLFTDLGPENLLEVERWLVGHPEAFDYGHLLEWLEAETGAAPEDVTRRLRESEWERVSFDWHHDPPSEWHDAFDVVSCHFFAESATSNEDEFVAMLERVPRLGRPGATVLMSFMCRSSGYTIDGADFPGFSVDEVELLRYLSDAGIRLTDLTLRSCQAEDPASAPGYEGLLFVTGRLAERRVPAPS